MSSSFEFNAPQFLDFNVGLDDSDGADTFFDVESEVPSQKEDDKENKSENPSVVSVKQEIITPPTIAPNSPLQSLKKQVKIEVQTPVISETFKEKSIQKEKLLSGKKRELKHAVRKLSGINKDSISVAKTTAFSSLAENLSEDLNKLSVKAKKRTHFDGIAVDIKEEKQHIMTTRKDQARNTPTMELRTRIVNKDVGNAESRKRKSNFGSSDNPIKYMAMAERVLHFQKDTPPRFHTSKRRSSGVHGSRFRARQSYKPRRTIALTPKLLTSFRSRPVDAPSQDEKEELQLEEMKRNQVKAMPLNEKALQPPKPIRKSIRPKTVPDPFNLTQVFKKPDSKPTDAKPYRFTANPLPKIILERPVGLGNRREIPVTIPESPAITKSTRFQKSVAVPMLTNDNKQNRENLNSIGVPCKPTLMKKTEVKPFSFETRDKEMMEKKEMKIQEVFMAEKRAREFKANPVPTFDVPKEVNRSSKYSHLDCSKTSVVSTAEEVHQPFKARSPKVLKKAPFRPNLEHFHSQPLDVQLRTQRRATERQEFEIKQLEKEEQLALMREQMDLEKKQKEEEEIAKLRQETVHKAQPMPKFKHPPKYPTSTMPLTEPKSPRFTRRIRTTSLCTNNQ